MTASPLRRSSIRQLAGWTAIAAVIAAGTAGCGSSTADDEATSGISPATSARRTDTAPTAPPAPTISATTIAEPTTTTTTATVPRPSGTRDELVDVGGGRLHIRCSGSGPTTVVLISGWNGDHTSFSAIESTLSATTRVCSYDKFGTGTSDPAPGAQRFSTQATDLHELLRMTNETGPYVVVGHSFGGAVAVTFASEFHDEVRGVLLLDATPTTWNSVLCAVHDDGTATAAALAQVCASQSAASNNPEGIEGPAAFAELAGIGPLGSLPLIVDTAADRGYAEQGASPELTTQLTDAWDAGQRHWASLSSHGELVEVPETGHHIHIDQADLVVEQITSLLT
jgi:pimeloyl-ACP methyl ester carboxylesterase